MNCSVCQRETTPVTIGGENYCSNCGTKYAPAAGAPKAAAPTTSAEPAAPRRMTDVAPRPANAAPAHAPAATALHQRAKPSHVLDLRPAAGDAAPAADTTPKAAPISIPKVTRPSQIPAAPPKTATHERHAAHLSARLDQAKQVGRSPLVGRFAGKSAHPALQTPAVPAPAAPNVPASAPGPATVVAPPTANTSSAPAHATAVVHPAPHPTFAPAPTPQPQAADANDAPGMPAHTAAQHAAMAQLARAAAPAHDRAQTPASPGTKASWRPNLKLSPRSSQALAVTAAIVIMAGYVWIQNYPKLALQAASGRAGVAASLPGYVPSSYNLARTDTAPGLITLSFTSPSIPDVLKIAQARTSWDSSSLLDNYVAKNTDDYTTVQGQGLTIYVFNNNQAAWVNHGVFYSIEGAARLSREQILKIAYSL